MAQLPGPGAFLDTGRIVSSLGFVAGMHIADLGCGSGFFAVATARMVGTNGIVTAVDIRQEPLDEVRAKAESMGLGNVRPVRGDLEVLGGTSIGDNTQDFAILENVLFQSKKKEAMIAEAVRMTKPGGRVVLIDWKKGEGGFGPPDELRTSEEDLKRMAAEATLKFERVLDVGQLYIGLTFVKP